MNENIVTEIEIQNFRAALEAKLNEERKATGFDVLGPIAISVQAGPKNFRIVRNDPHTSVHCFVERATGNILKAAGWKAPAKHSRGNIRVGDASNWWNGAIGEYGAAYL